MRVFRAPGFRRCFWRWRVAVALAAAAKKSLAALAAIALAACGESEFSGLRLAGSTSAPFETDAMYELIDEYNAAGGGPKASFQLIQANYTEKIQLMLGTNTAPDVFVLESFWAPSLISYDALMPLDDFIAADPAFGIDDFEPNLLDAFRRDGKLYGLPKDYSTLALYYNPDMFAAAGIAEPPGDWRALAGAARRLTADRDGDGETDQYGFGAVESIDYLLPFIWQNGGELLRPDGGVDYEDPRTIEAIEFVKGMKDGGYAAVPTEMGSAWNMEAFGRGRAAMAFSGLWAVNFLATTFPDTPYKVAPLPCRRPCAGPHRSIAYVVGYVIPASTTRPEDAWRLLRHLTNREAQMKWAAREIGLPPRRSVVRAAGLLDDPRRRVFIEAAGHARTWQLGDNQRLLDELQTAMQSVFLTGADTRDALRRADGRL